MKTFHQNLYEHQYGIDVLTEDLCHKVQGMMTSLRFTAVFVYGLLKDHFPYILFWQLFKNKY